MRIDVTAEDIKQGTRDDPHCCAVARAIRRATEGAYVDVNCFRLLVNGKRFPATHEMTEFVCAFDEGEPVEPFSFDLELEP